MAMISMYGYAVNQPVAVPLRQMLHWPRVQPGLSFLTKDGLTRYFDCTESDSIDNLSRRCYFPSCAASIPDRI
jgi:hypothetical protein